MATHFMSADTDALEPAANAIAVAGLKTPVSHSDSDVRLTETWFGVRLIQG